MRRREFTASLTGAAGLPVGQCAKFLLVVGLETAKTLGLTVAESLLLRASEVVE